MMHEVSGSVPWPRRQKGEDGRLSNRHTSSVSASSSPPEEDEAGEEEEAAAAAASVIKAPVGVVAETDELPLLAVWRDVSSSSVIGAQDGIWVNPVVVS